MTDPRSLDWGRRALF